LSIESRGGGRVKVFNQQSKINNRQLFRRPITSVMFQRSPSRATLFSWAQLPVRQNTNARSANSPKVRVSARSSVAFANRWWTSASAPMVCFTANLAAPPANTKHPI